MSFWSRSVPVDTPVLVVDALGFASQIKACDPQALSLLSQKLDRQYHRFRAKTPFGVMLVTATKVFGSSEFSTFRLNDMFVLFAANGHGDAAHRHLVTSILLFQVLLLEGFIPRGGLGAGLVLRSEDSILGGGFIDAYESAEKRSEAFRHICAIQLSPAFIARMPQSRMTLKLVSFYDGGYFVNPCALTDPEMGPFDAGRILRLLKTSGIDGTKLSATSRFLAEAEDYDAALAPGSRSWRFVQSHGGPGGPAE